jgi:hypothetical protein
MLFKTWTTERLTRFCYKYGIGFYLSYLSRWPDLCCTQEAPSGRMMGYGMYAVPNSSMIYLTHVTNFSPGQGRGYWG